MLIDDLIHRGYLKTSELIKAFQKIKRIDFLPDEVKNLSEINEALPVGGGQTISQPAVVTFMLELLEPKAGDKILDVGSGSGWTTALLAYVVSQKGISNFTRPNFQKKLGRAKIKNQKSKIDGRVIAIEIIPELKEFGERNVAKYSFIERGVVKFFCADGSKGFKKEAPFDKILVSAAAKECPESLKEQIKIGGRIVIPIENSIWLLIKKSVNFRKEGYQFEEREYPGFVFVPLIGKRETDSKY